MKWYDLVREGVGRVFLGTSEHALDDKLRLVLPKIYREVFGTSVYVTRGFGKGYLSLYTEEVFTSLSASLYQKSPFDREAQSMKRVFFSNSCALKVDSIGRVTLPKSLMEKMEIGRQVVLVGTGDHMEIWDASAYASEDAQGEENYQCLAQKMAQ